MGLQNDTSTTVIQTGGANTVGQDLGQSATDLVGFYGKAPIAQRSNANQVAITDSSGGTANIATGVAALTGTYNSTIIANALATVVAQLTEFRTSLVNLGLIKGS